jgi:hypothetical protein
MDVKSLVAKISGNQETILASLGHLVEQGIVSAEEMVLKLKQ